MIEILLIIQQLIASGTHIIAKNLTSEVEPSVVLFFRALISAAAFVGFLLWRKNKIKRIEFKDVAALILLGALNIPINQFLFLTSIKMTSPPNVALAYALTPAFVLVISFFMINEKPTFLKTLGIFIAISGTVIVLSLKGFDFNSEGFIGDLLALAASISWAFYTVLGKKMVTKYGAIYVTGIAMVFGLLLYLPVFHLLPVQYHVSDFSLVNWGQFIYLGVMTSAVAYALWYYALKRMEASKLSVFNNLQTVFTTILSIIFLGYQLEILFVLGGIMIIAGVIITQRG